MKMSRMQDVGGCRSVLPNLQKVNELIKLYEKSRGLKNKLSNKFLAGALSAKKSLPIIVANTLKVSRNNSAKTVKPIKGKALQYDTDNGLKEIILKELVRYANPSGADIAPKIETGCLEQSIKVARAGNQFPMPSDAPYVILPIRKMKNTEREEVLRKVP